MSPKKEVRWKLTVDEFRSHDSPESWTAPLPSPPPAHIPDPLPAPRPVHDLPLPAILEIHPALAPAHALQLDFSFPSDAFRRNPQLTQTLLDTPACTPMRPAVYIRVAAGLYEQQWEIVHNPRGQPVTVGDILTGIQSKLRQYDYGNAPPEAAPYMLRRIATVNGYCEGRDARNQAANVAAEREGKGRFADHLLGHTMFAGLTLQLGQGDNFWQLELVVPQRYAY
ncbi:hypothetical protein DFH09DRAFT_1146475 [Mycena vulgaris]|nr:hypothetical protein DFH09DRAFT_1146475 [Mycena vulgaris]